MIVPSKYIACRPYINKHSWHIDNGILCWWCFSKDFNVSWIVFPIHLHPLKLRLQDFVVFLQLVHIVLDFQLQPPWAPSSPAGLPPPALSAAQLLAHFLVIWVSKSKYQREIIWLGNQLHRSNLLHLLLCSSSLISADCPGWFASKQAFKRGKMSCRQICTFWVHWLKNTHFLVTLTLIHNTLMAVWQNYLYIPKSPSS